MNRHNYSGILFIGDPHISSRSVSTRVECDFIALSVGKLNWSLTYARKNNLLPVCLGDLFTKKNDNNIGLLSELMSVLSQSPDMISLLGNHDSGEHGDYNNDDAISIVASSGLIKIANENGVIGNYMIGDELITLGATPYGHDIPTEVRSENEVVWITHHDLNFDPRFAKINCHEIKGCRTVVNGHLHKTFPPMDMGSTRWHNPGNILRMSTTEKDHVPSVWCWTPKDVHNLHQVIVPHDKDVFVEMPSIKVNDEDDLDASLLGESRSVFVESLRADVALEAVGTNDGSLVSGYIDRLEKHSKYNAVDIEIVRGMLASVCESSDS